MGMSSLRNTLRKCYRPIGLDRVKDSNMRRTAIDITVRSFDTSGRFESLARSLLTCFYETAPMSRSPGHCTVAKSC